MDSKPGRLLGIDYGEARVGLALSDPLGLTAQPLTTLERRGDKHICRDIEALVGERGVTEVVVGLPLDMSGQRGASAQKVDAFVERLRRYITIPVLLRDERLTTTQAERVMDQARSGRSRRDSRKSREGRKKREAVVDQVAAVLILQSELDARRLAREWSDD